jgi:hypothetical protein
MAVFSRNVPNSAAAVFCCWILVLQIPELSPKMAVCKRFAGPGPLKRQGQEARTRAHLNLRPAPAETAVRVCDQPHRRLRGRGRYGHAPQRQQRQQHGSLPVPCCCWPVAPVAQCLDRQPAAGSRLCCLLLWRGNPDSLKRGAAARRHNSDDVLLAGNPLYRGSIFVGVQIKVTPFLSAGHSNPCSRKCAAGRAGGAHCGTPASGLWHPSAALSLPGLPQVS